MNTDAPTFPRPADGLASVVRENRGPWLCGALLGIAAYLLTQSGLVHLGPVGWSVALLFAVIATPIHIVTDLTFPLWGYLGAPGAWAVAVVTAALYHGVVGLWLGNTFRHRPKRALALGAAVLVAQFCVYVLWQTVSVG